MRPTLTVSSRVVARLGGGLALLLACALSTACVSVHDDVFHHKLPRDAGSLYRVLEAASDTMPSDPPGGSERALENLRNSVVGRAIHNALVAYSPMGALDDTLKRKSEAEIKKCLAAAGARDRAALQNTVDQVSAEIKKVTLRLSHFKDFLAELDRLRSELEGLGPLRLVLSVGGPKDPSAERSLVHFLGGYSSKDEPQWLTVGGGMPTLARVLGLDDKTMPDKIPPGLKGIIEAAKDDDGAGGIGPNKLKVMRLAGGVAGDRAKVASSMIVRTVGGIHYGQFVLGKWSIGDNETLSKVAETVFDLLAKRTSASIAAQVLYAKPFPKGFDWLIDAVGKVTASIE